MKLAILLFVILLALAVGAVLFAYWVASGEPDVNGDPERDAGLLGRDAQ